MTPLEFKKSGAIWRLASVYGPLYNDHRETDVCSYTRAVLWGAFIVLLITLAISLALFPIGDTLAWAVALVTVGWITPDDLVLCGFVLYAALAVLVGSIYLFEGYKERRRLSDDVPREPSFIGEAWTAFKEKTCVRVRLS